MSTGPLESFLVLTFVCGMPVVLVVALVWLLIRERSYAARITRLTRRQECLACGHDLTGTIGDNCSECGAPVAPPACEGCRFTLCGIDSDACPECGRPIPAQVRPRARRVREAMRVG